MTCRHCGLRAPALDDTGVCSICARELAARELAIGNGCDGRELERDAREPSIDSASIAPPERGRDE